MTAFDYNPWLEATEQAACRRVGELTAPAKSAWAKPAARLAAANRATELARAFGAMVRLNRAVLAARRVAS